MCELVVDSTLQAFYSATSLQCPRRALTSNLGNTQHWKMTVHHDSTKIIYVVHQSLTVLTI